MTSDVLTLEQKLHAFALLRRRRIGKLAVVRALWTAVLGALILVYADLLFILPAQIRIMLAALYLVLVFAVAVGTYRSQVRSRSERRLVARLVEQGAPNLDNDLINAIDFEEVLSGPVRPEVSSELMSHEISLAAEKTSIIESTDTLRPPTLRTESKLLLALIIAAATVTFLFAGVFAAIVPRYLEPWGDHPPYSPTSLIVDPAGVTVEYGSNQVIRVAAGGRKPAEMSLVLENEEGERVGEMAMLDAGDGTFYQTIQNVQNSLVYYASIPRGRSKRYPLTLSKIPRIDSVSVTYTYPEYTNLPSKSRLLAKDNATLAGYAGTKARLEFTSNRPLKGGPVSLGQRQLALTPNAESTTASVEFLLDEGDSISAKLLDVEGIESSDAFKGMIEVLPDKRPEIAFVSPGKHAFAIPDAKIPLVLEARDDLGLKNISLYRNLNASPDDLKEIYQGSGSEIFTSVTEMLDLGDLGVRPGDIIEYYATVTDTLPTAPQTAATPAYQIAIISAEAYRDFMQEQMTADDLKEKYDAMLSRIESIAAAQEKLEAETRALQERMTQSGELTPGERRTLEKAREGQADLAAQASKLAEEMRAQAQDPAVFDIEEDYKKSLQEFAEHLEQAQKEMMAGQERMSEAETGKGEAGQQALAQAQQHQENALEQLGRTSQEFQEQIQQANEDLQNIYKLLNDVEQFKQLYGSQQMLERQARTYKDVQSPDLDQQIRMKELAEAQQEIREALEQIRDQLRQHADEVEKDYPQVAEDARGIADGIETLQIPGTMDSASGNLNAAKAPAGHADAKKALEDLESMIAFCNAAQGEGSSQCELRLKVQMSIDPGNTLGQLSKSLGKSGSFPGMGASGQGGGMASSSVPFDLYGSESFGKAQPKESRASAVRAHDTQAAPEASGGMAGSFEELATTKSDTLAMDAGSGEHVVEEYRALIEAYFRSLAEEQQ
ncbi:MAG: hypothetical protein IT365_19955 [Candidatus Hydrogenedentes bacterium]|nr:hypothetical protein [Candidatus Hydrogenedentota bacterium]